MLFDLAELIGMTYRQINVLIFCVLWPMFTAYLIILVRKQGKRIKKLEQLTKDEK